MIYTIFFRKLQKKLVATIQTMGYPERQKVYTPHLDIEEVQRENDNYYHCENENDNNNENNYYYDSMNDNDNHFHFLGKCGNGYGVRWY